MRAIGYCRVSSSEQVDGTSLKSQEGKIRAYCAMKGIDLSGVLVDAGVSGGKPLATRPEGGKLEEVIQGREVEAVIITKLDRGFRSVVDCLQTVDSWEQKNVALHIIDLGGNSIDTTSPAGRFMLTVLSAAAEMERGMIRDRCNEGRKARKAQGFRIGEVPYGWILASDKESLVEAPEEQAALRLIRDMKTNGHSLRAIAAELNRRGYSAKKRGAWSHGQVQSVLRRAA